MNSIPITIPKELFESISVFEYVNANQLVKIQFTEKYQNKLIFQPFKVTAIEKSLKELERKIKGAIPHLLNSQYIEIESALYEDLDKIVKLQEEDDSQPVKGSEKTLQLRKFAFDGKIYESVLVENKPYFITSNESGSYSLEERIEIAGNTFLPQDNITTVNPLPYKFESEEELEKYFTIGRNETFDSLFTKVRSEFRKYVNVPEHTLTVLSADIVYSYFQDKFGTTHYNVFIGENGSGKNSAMLVFKHLGYRVFYVTAASAANYYTFLGVVQEGQGTIAEDEADDIGEDKDKQRILKTGYANGGTVPKIEFSKNGTRSQKPYLTFCHKWLAMEEIPDEREIRGVLDRSFTFNFLVGDVQYNIKDIVKGENSELYKEISDLRKTLFVFKILHQNDEFEDIHLNIKNRNAELTKPLLRLFNGSACSESIRKSFSVLINEKSKIKSNSTESKILEALNRLIVAKYEEGKEVYQFSNEEIFEALKRSMDGLDNNLDDGTYSTFITPDGLYVSKKKITQLLKSKFNAVPDKIFVKGETKRVVRVNKEWLEKLGKQYEIIDEIRILRSKPDIKEEDRHCEPDTMTDQTLVESGSPNFEKGNEENIELKEQNNVSLLINANNNNTNSLPNTSQAGANEENSDVKLTDIVVTNNKLTENVVINPELNINNNDISSTNSPYSNIDKNSASGNLKELPKIGGQAPPESVRSVRSVRNSNNEPKLKEYDDNEDIDFDSLKGHFWKEFLKIEEKEDNDKFTKLKVIGHGKLKKALVDIPKEKNQSLKLTMDVLNKLINRLLKEGMLAELTEGRYYRTGNSRSNSSVTASATPAAAAA
ncbi:MAG TPA: hypothetical protein VD815_05775 [Candidatus Saccharimonadales bacterium]|nr:hypothetical protein [Candidatus Saccharimonadales bacterium]